MDLSGSGSLKIIVPEDSTYDFDIGTEIFIIVQQSKFEITKESDDVMFINTPPGFYLDADSSDNPDDVPTATLLKVDNNSWLLKGDLTEDDTAV